MASTMYITIFLLFWTGMNALEMSAQTYVAGDYTAFSDTEFINGLGIFEKDANMWHSFSSTPVSGGSLICIAVNGSSIFVGGKFIQVNQTQGITNIVQYDAITNTFIPLCGGVSGQVNWISIVDSLVYVAGEFQTATNCDNSQVIANNVAYFDLHLQQWNHLDKGLSGVVTSIAVATPAGLGPLYLYATGTGPGGPFISEFNGLSWYNLIESLPSDVDNVYNVVAVDPNTRDLYVGGTFQTFQGVPGFNSMAMRHDNQWSSIANGVTSNQGDATINTINFVTTKNTSLIVFGGFFDTAGGNVPSNNLVFFNGTSWISPDNGVTGDIVNFCNPQSSFVSDTMVIDDIIAVAGRFTSAGNTTRISVNNVAFYNITSSTWCALGNDSQFKDLVMESITFNADGTLFVAGKQQEVFTFAEYPTGSPMLYSWNFTEKSWNSMFNSPLESFFDGAFIHSVIQNGTDVIIGGNFMLVGEQFIHNIAIWDGSSWNALGSGIRGGIIHSMQIFGDNLYVGGNFNYTTEDGQRLIGIGRFDSISGKWFQVDGGIQGDCMSDNAVYAVSADDQHIYFGGSFSRIGNGTNSNSPNIAMWHHSNSTWIPMAGFPEPPAAVYTMYLANSEITSHRTTLFIAGNFQHTDQVRSDNLAAWDVESGSWNLTNSGVDLFSENSQNPSIRAITVFRERIWIGGNFDEVNGNTVNNIAVSKNDWQWTNVDVGVTSSTNMAMVYALAHDDAQDVLYAGGVFDNAGKATPVNNVAYYAGHMWNGLADIAQWQGPARCIFVSLSLQPLTALPFWTPKIIATVVISGLLSLFVLAMVGFILYRRRRMLNGYVEIPTYRKKVSTVKDIAEEVEVTQIRIQDIQIGARISVGAGGEVSRGMWKDQEVAIKRIYGTGGMSLDAKSTVDFMNEIKIMSQLSHENILRLFGASISKSDEIFLVTEYMEHGSLQDILHKTEGKLDWKLKIRLAMDAACGMTYLHSHEPPIIHRDLKASNLLIDKRWRCKIADFGVSRMKPLLTQTMSIVGTPAYMAPEVIARNECNERADIYSFAVVLCELHSQLPPYHETTLFPQQVMFAVVNEGLRPTIQPDCPPAFALLIKDCWHQDPIMRPTFKEIKSRLSRMQSSKEYL